MTQQPDLNFDRRSSFIRSIHQSPTELVLALSGGGSLVLGDLLSIPGGSKTLIEATVPYSEESLSRYIGRVPDRFCSQRTARYLAMTAFHRGLRSLRARKAAATGHILKEKFNKISFDVSHESEEPRIPHSLDPLTEEEDLEDYLDLIGIGCTASLVTDRTKKGEYRVHVAAQTLRRTCVFSLQLVKDARTRWEEERLVADLILNVIETARKLRIATSNEVSASSDSDENRSDESIPFYISRKRLEEEDLFCNTFGRGTTDKLSVDEVLPLPLKEGERIRGRQTVGSPPLVDMFFGKTWAVLWQNGGIRHFRLRRELPTLKMPVFNPQAEFTQAIFPGSFNPIHQGHLEMIDIAEHRLGSRVALEISVQNVEKPSLDYIELENRLREIDRVRPGQPVWFTQTPLFEDKAELFRGAMFVVGADTLRRFADLRYYHENTHQLHDVLRMIAFHNCRFLVFARQGLKEIESLRTLNIPDMLRSLADEVPETEFAMNISSSDLRRNEF